MLLNKSEGKKMMDGAELKKYRLEFSTRKDGAGNVKPMKQQQFANIFNISREYLSNLSNFIWIRVREADAMIIHQNNEIQMVIFRDL